MKNPFLTRSRQVAKYRDLFFNFRLARWDWASQSLTLVIRTVHRGRLNRCLNKENTMAKATKTAKKPVKKTATKKKSKK